MAQGINGEGVNSQVEPNTEKEYEKAQNLFCAHKGKKDPVASAYALELLKDFVHHLAYGIEGRYDDEAAGQGGADEFLCETVFPTCGNKRVKRRRKHARKSHFIHLSRQLWENDYHEYAKPIIRVSLWAQMLRYVFSSARLCEYLEGVSRANSRRGLYCKVSRPLVGLLQEESYEPELVFQVVKDAKSMTNTPEKWSVAVVRSRFYIADSGILDPNMNFMKDYRQDHSIFYNSMLPILAMSVASDRLRDYHPNCPLFEGLDGLRQKAALAKMLRECAVRAVYATNPTMHDFRTRGLISDSVLDEHYSKG
ncbi:hypothetical protein DPV78_006686 [Talaromyces pinophilus]|nr:hypothetical protein DPV78_006686 [Talaromyces pinophilus]